MPRGHADERIVREERHKKMKEKLTERIVDTAFDFWCEEEYGSDIIAAVDTAIQQPTEDSIFQAISITEANAFKAGFRICLEMFRELLCKE